MDLSDSEVSEIHRSLTTIEASFESMKSELGMRTNFHKKDEMTKAHIYITVIAYHILIPILKKLKAKGMHYCWNTVRELLKSHVRVTTTFNTKGGDTVSLRSSTNPPPKQKEIYNALKIRQKPLKRMKTIFKGENVVPKS